MSHGTVIVTEWSTLVTSCQNPDDVYSASLGSRFTTNGHVLPTFGQRSITSAKWSKLCWSGCYR
ncbi:hypothetical protein MVEG_04102 [Podila verticillata NRRL 6337]|nr:hypothetical protein MVEG_04102 [Podila verticillata NRRL 6337]